MKSAFDLFNDQLFADTCLTFEDELIGAGRQVAEVEPELSGISHEVFLTVNYYAQSIKNAEADALLIG